MALIECPECGNKVSDKAAACIHCGAPLQVNQSVKIKILRFSTGMMNQNASEAEIQCDGSVLWSGFSGQVANFEINTATSSIAILIKHAYTGHPNPFFRDFTITGIVEQGKSYTTRQSKASVSKFLGIVDPTTSEWILSEVDSINTGL